MGPPAGGWLQAGRVGRAHGLDGSFYVRDATPQLLELGAAVVIGERRSKIVRRAGDDRRPIIRLEHYTDRESVEALNGQRLMVQRSEAPALDSDEWWAEDLVGCTVHDVDREVGRVARLLALPTCEVLEVTLSDGSGELLVPLVADAVRAVDIDRKRIEVNVGFIGAD